ncbi:alanine--tRNA ligase [Georgenia thermotolerans]|uniref:Alanine--tRNA ligase n=1 Tax=Georgenia thermotolerans TaxID=527326 RepID=A0A7J5UMY8_9MICO|nr:alanine--tRNA ligase [Georgenia thermotolerans]KAE8763729.1 alanine--tRNA ligase [Georgenia thermotolerans]
MRTAEIRTRWLDYFAKQDHHIAPSVPLVSPDPSILFTIAGMVPFIPYIVGTQQAPWPRAASVQKCIRTNDIEEVGKTTRHGTFFQMAGNFSFGDYFKEGAITMAWELLTSSPADGGYGLEPERLWITVWDQDAEAKDIWLNKIGLPAERLQFQTREENFWDTGQPGPAGPTSEIHYDRGPAYGPDGGPEADTQGDRFVEIWNLVFDQYLRGEGAGKDYPLLHELEQKAIDTGLGVERLAFILQDRANMYETDEVFPVIEAAEALSGRSYTRGASSANPDDVRMRVVADHVRSAMMLIADGVRPGNDGRGYVLRRLIRRAVRSMRLLGVEEPSLPVLLPASKDAMKGSYPELETDFDRISQVAYEEEEAFRRTLTAGTTILDTAVNRAKSSAGTAKPVLSGADAFALHDTYGFPIDLTLEMAAEHGVSVDETGFRSLMDEQRQRARADALAKKTGHVDTSLYTDLQNRLGGPVQFLGYTDTTAEARVVGLLVDGVPAPSATAPADVEVVLDRTPFYAEAGGQLADQGTITFEGGAIVDVADVQAPIKGLSVHRGQLTEGTLTLDERGVAAIDTARRKAIARAHTATHMVHKALHEFLGDQATQAGSENAPSRLRFDFRHGSAVPASVLGDVEGRVNERLADNLDVTDEIMDIDDAKAAGAMALFGEKYGRNVRVVSIGGDWSKELCGGTHVPQTGTLGLVTVLGESSIGSGVRRVDALVGAGAYGYHAREHALVSQVTSLLGGRPEELPERVDSLMTKLKAAEKELAALRQKQLLAAAGTVADGATQVGTGRVVTHDAGEVAAADDLRTLALDVRARLGESAPAVIAVGGVAKERPVVVVATNAAARQAGVRAGALVRGAAKTLGGGGGGKDDVAQGGGTDVAALGAALDGVRAEVATLLGA